MLLSARKTERRTVMEVKMIREYVSMLEKEGLLDFVIGADGHKKLEASVKDISYPMPFILVFKPSSIIVAIFSISP